MAEEKKAKKTEEKAAEKKAAKATEKTAEKKAEKETEKAPAVTSVKAEASEAAKTADLHPTLQKKKEAREAKAARKAANIVEEKKSRPNNTLLAILILGGLIGMFVFAAGYNYLSMPESLQEYIKENSASYSNMQIDDYTVATFSAEGNSMNIDLNSTVEEGVMEEYLKEIYSGDEGKEQLEDLAAYFLTGMKPAVRGFNADVTIKMIINGTEINSAKLTYKEAKKKLKDAEKESEEEADDEADSDDDLDADTDVETDEETVETEGDGHVHEEGEEHVHEEAEESGN